MAITFLQAQKRQRYLFLTLVLLVFLILLIVWWSFFKGEEIAIPSSVAPVSSTFDIRIAWDVLEDAKLAELRLFEEIVPFEDEIGREEPFRSY